LLEVTMRVATPDDSSICGQICYDAFLNINAGRLVGRNCLYERSAVGGVGPITVDPSTQHVGVGRKLMQAVMDRAKGRNVGLRLVQAAFHNRSLALYTPACRDERANELFPGVWCGRRNRATLMPATHCRGECMDTIEAPN
jgi:GNAT superfamily N-acetyltransferase